MQIGFVLIVHINLVLIIDTVQVYGRLWHVIFQEVGNELISEGSLSGIGVQTHLKSLYHISYLKLVSDFIL